MSKDNSSDVKETNKRNGGPVEVYAEKAETKAPDVRAEEMKALALAYAKYLKEKGLEPGDATFTDTEELIAEAGMPAGVSPMQGAQDGEIPAQGSPARSAQAGASSAAASSSEVPAGGAPSGETPAHDLQTDGTQAAATPLIEVPGPEDVPSGSDDLKALAAAYARKLRDKGLEPGEVMYGGNAEDEDAGSPDDTEAAGSAEITEAAADNEEKAAGKKMTLPEIEATLAYKRSEAEKKKKRKGLKKERSEKKEKNAKKAGREPAEEKTGKSKAAPKDMRSGASDSLLVSVMDAHDRLQDRWDESFGRMVREFIAWVHRATSTYRNSRRTIGIGVLIVGTLAMGILILFDSLTVYEYAYNGKVLGYVKEQEEVTEVLDVAGAKLSQNNGEAADIEFVANQNVTFNPVDGRGRSTDDMDTAINKLMYMTDIETEAYAVTETGREGSRIVAIVKDSEAADDLLAESLEVLSRPDIGMELESAEFMNELSVSPINVLLSSVQSSEQALELMTKGGSMDTFHIVEEGETLESIAAAFGAAAEDIYDEENENIVTEVMQGDKICIRSSVEPVGVRMVESGKMKEIIEYETIKKKSDEYYQGDTYLEQEGRNGVQIFEGTLTRENGEIVDRDEISTTVTREKRDKIILVGTKERPKTAPTGTYALPLQSYVVTSEFGGRWGRMHEGIDLGASTGTPIYASDGGTVVTAGWYGGYGQCIDIDHENGRVTRYGHCSQLLVSVGDKVYQGQLIGLVGNTGNSFGSHLHFEIRLNGAAVNPRGYVDF